MDMRYLRHDVLQSVDALSVDACHGRHIWSRAPRRSEAIIIGVTAVIKHFAGTFYGTLTSSSAAPSASCSALPVVMEGNMVRRRLGNGSAATPPPGQGRVEAGQQDAGTAVAVALRGTAPDGGEGSPPATGIAVADEMRKPKRRKATDSAVVPEKPAGLVQAPPDAPPAAQTGVDPMQDAVRSKKRRKRVGSDRQPDEGPALREPQPGTNTVDAFIPATSAGAAAAKAGSLDEAAQGTNDLLPQRSRKRKQHQAARAHGGDGPTATEAQLATIGTDDTHGAGAEPAAAAEASSPSHATERPVKGGGHAEQPKRRTNKATLEQARQQAPGPLAADPHSTAAEVPPAAERGRTEDGEAPAEQPKKRRRRDVPEQIRPQAASALALQMVSSAAAAADEERRSDTSELPAKQPKGRKAKAAKPPSDPDNRSHDALAAAEAEPSAHRKARGGAVEAAGAGVTIHGDGPAWREHAARNDVRTGRYSESEKQTIRDAVAQCAIFS